MLGVEEALAARVPDVEALEVLRAAPVVVRDDERRLVPQRAAAPSASGSRTRCPRPPPRARSARRSRRARAPRCAAAPCCCRRASLRGARRSGRRAAGRPSSTERRADRRPGRTRPVTIAPGCVAASRQPVDSPVRRNRAVVVGHEHDVVRRRPQSVVSRARDAEPVARHDPSACSADLGHERRRWQHRDSGRRRGSRPARVRSRRATRGSAGAARCGRWWGSRP